MDSKVLTQEQIKELVRFIHSRGFREPVVVLEILDHFACKVEELLASSPYMTFGHAMHQAHRSFGAKGFKPIVTSFEEQTDKKYKTLFWKNFKQLVSKPGWMVFLPVIAIGYFKFFMWSVVNEHKHILDISDAFFIFFLAIVALQLALWFSVTKEERRHPFAKASITSGNFTGFTGALFFILVTGFNSVPNNEYAWILGILYTVFFVYSIPRFFAARQTIKKAQHDIDTVKRMAIYV